MSDYPYILQSILQETKKLDILDLRVRLLAPKRGISSTENLKFGFQKSGRVDKRLYIVSKGLMWVGNQTGTCSDVAGWMQNDALRVNYAFDQCTVTLSISASLLCRSVYRHSFDVPSHCRVSSHFSWSNVRFLNTKTFDSTDV